jgi:transketolase
MAKKNRVKLKDTRELQGKLRLKILELHKKSNSGHIASSLSCIDIMIASLLQCNKDDIFILSKGHAASAYYLCLHHLGLISSKELNTFSISPTKFPAHPPANIHAGICFATGSLGHGFPFATGMALAKKLNREQGHVFVLISDGDCNEGTTWEAMHFASRHKLNKLIVLIDNNHIQGIDFSKNVLGDTCRAKFWTEAGFDLAETQGHEPEKIHSIIEKFKKSKNSKPKVIIAKTTKGKGVSFMENTIDWHYWPMNEEQYKVAQSDIKKNYLKER